MSKLAPALAAILMLSTAVAPADLDKLMGPVALYPDALLGQMLLCASNPGKIGALDEWLVSHPSLKGTELQDAAKQAGFEDSFVALTVFPDVVAWMAARHDWAAKVGQAFAADRSAVFASIQRLRSKAKAAGTLKSTPQQTVETQTTDSGQQVIVIEPANPQIVYVPQYNPEVVYVPSSTTVVVEQSSSANAVAAGVIGFTAGIAIGAAFDNDYYYGPYGWGGGYRMYDDAWDDWDDARDDARDDWTDHREDMAGERSERAGDKQEQRTDRQQNRVEYRPATSGTAAATAQSRGYSGEKAATRSGSGSDAFGNYSSGKSERSASQRGKSSRSSSRGSGGRRK